ncbi:MAG: cyclodeaminase/cyclohydrolase family protein [Acidobacteriota bacterium]
MNKLTSLPFHTVLAQVAAPAPTPAGGAVAALAGASGTALAEMVAALPRTRQNAAAERAALEQVLPALTAARARLEKLADLDVEAFERLLTAFRLPKGSDAEKTARRAAVTDATKDATLVPLETARTCADVLKLMETVADAGHRAAASDLFVGVSLVRAAAEGAAANVRANLESLADPAFVLSSTRRLMATLDDVTHSAHTALGSLHG